MSNYSKLVNYIVKDALPSGNTAKIIRGTELDNEFSAISSAISSKLDSSGGSLINGSLSGTTTIAGNLNVSATTSITGSLSASSFNSNNAVITGGSVNATPVGNTTPSTGSFTSLVANSGTVNGSLSVTGTVNTPTVNGATTLALQTGGSTKVLVDNAGNAGLGVVPSAWGAAYRAFQTVGAGAFFSSGATGAAVSTNIFNDGTNNRYLANGAAYLYTNGDTHRWYTAPSGTAGATINFRQDMTLTQGGDLGVGTTLPACKIDTSGVIRAQGAAIAASGEGIELIYTTATPWIPSTNQGLVQAFNRGTATHTPISVSGSLIALAINGTERARITGAGQFLVGAAAIGAGRLAVQANSATEAIPYASNDTRADAATSQSFAFFRQGTQVGNISTTTTATSFNTSSDYRLKNNQQPLTGSGTFIDSLMPKTWDWSADGSKGVGFIAHEVQAVSPQSVTGEKDAVDADGKPVYQAMEYGSAEFIANIVAELQSVRKRLAALEAK